MSIDLKRIVAGPEAVDRACYTSQEVFEAERELIFARSWLFVAHESELASPGDYRAMELAGQPVMAIRGDDGRIRVFFNSCRHKATTIVADDTGNCAKLRCAYHHWTYDLQGRLMSVPRVEAYGAGFRLADHGLVEVPRVEHFKGMVFANLDPHACTLAEFLGTAAPYLGEVAQYQGEDLVAVGAYRYTYPANWKLLMENTLDDYHAEYLHDYAFAQRAKVFDMKGTTGYQEAEGKRWSVDLGIHGAYDQYDDVRTLKIQQDRARRVYVGIFPSLIALYQPLWDVTGLRIIEPVSLEETHVLNYCLVPKSASPEKRKEIAERYHYSWGPGGRAGVDDIFIFREVQRGLRANGVGRVLINRGIHRTDPVGAACDDHAVRGFWAGWREYMQHGGLGRAAEGS